MKSMVPVLFVLLLASGCDPYGAYYQEFGCGPEDKECRSRVEACVDADLKELSAAPDSEEDLVGYCFEQAESAEVVEACLESDFEGIGILVCLTARADSIRACDDAYAGEPQEQRLACAVFARDGETLEACAEAYPDFGEALFCAMLIESPELVEACESVGTTENDHLVCVSIAEGRDAAVIAACGQVPVSVEAQVFCVGYASNVDEVQSCASEVLLLQGSERDTLFQACVLASVGGQQAAPLTGRVAAEKARLGRVTFSSRRD
jgi:hypothetical protein